MITIDPIFDSILDELPEFDEDVERILDLAAQDYPEVDREVLAQLQDELGLFE